MHTSHFKVKFLQLLKLVNTSQTTEISSQNGIKNKSRPFFFQTGINVYFVLSSFFAIEGIL